MELSEIVRATREAFRQECGADLDALLGDGQPVVASMSDNLSILERRLFLLLPYHYEALQEAVSGGDGQALALIRVRLQSLIEGDNAEHRPLRQLVDDALYYASRDNLRPGLRKLVENYLRFAARRAIDRLPGNHGLDEKAVELMRAHVRPEACVYVRREHLLGQWLSAIDGAG